jgi:NAD(P)-dependent dehydrogenase (short-subunit alcohol dehydrogenase family)
MRGEVLAKTAHGPALDLIDKVAIITGGATGIGAGIATVFAELGASIVLAARDADRGATVAARLGGTFIQADIASSTDIDRLAARTLDHFGRIDVLVNNAATTTGMGPYVDLTEADYDTMLDVNLRGTFFLTQRVARAMIDQRTGSIVMIGSNISLMSEPDASHYMASKGALNSLTYALASELGPHGIRVNTIAPGEIDVERDPDVYVTGPGRERIERVPLRRPGTPRDVALLAAFLASDASAYISGAIIPVDGGQLAT